MRLDLPITFSPANDGCFTMHVKFTAPDGLFQSAVSELHEQFLIGAKKKMKVFPTWKAARDTAAAKETELAGLRREYANESKIVKDKGLSSSPRLRDVDRKILDVGKALETAISERQQLSAGASGEIEGLLVAFKRTALTTLEKRQGEILSAGVTEAVSDELCKIGVQIQVLTKGHIALDQVGLDVPVERDAQPVAVELEPAAA